jgi:hypothetical protein
MFNANLATRLSLEEANNEIFISLVAGLLESSCCLVGILLKRFQKVVFRFLQGHSDDPGCKVADTSMISALVRGGKEDEQAGRFED